MNKATRGYDNREREKAKLRTRQRILRAAYDLWWEGESEDLTLQQIADRSGVTVQTVIRHFGSKEGLLGAAIEEDAGGIRAERAVATPGDVGQALDILLRHYERDGETVLRTLALEGRIPMAAQIAAAGRSAHRDWCETVFEPFLPPADSDLRTARLDAFVAATDLFVWKLYRQDLGYSLERTRAGVRALLDGLVALQR